MAEQVDTVVIGGGVVGLACARTLAQAGRDVVFQWDKPQQVIGNLGLMAMRCNARVERMWAVTRESVTRYMARDTANSLLMGGDQHTVNKLLYQPTLAGAAPVRWGVLPPEVATRTSLKRRGM